MNTVLPDIEFLPVVIYKYNAWYPGETKIELVSSGFCVISEKERLV